jgi:hypothetical protein
LVCFLSFLIVVAFFTDWKTSLNNCIPVHLTVICPHHRRLCFYYWTCVCSNCDMFHLLGTDKCRCKTTKHCGLTSPPPILHLLFNTLISYIPVPWNYFPLNYFHPMFIN